MHVTDHPRTRAADPDIDLFEETFEHLSPDQQRLAVAVALVRMRDMPAWRRGATGRQILRVRSTGRHEQAARCCRRVLARWLHRERDRAA